MTKASSSKTGSKRKPHDHGGDTAPLKPIGKKAAARAEADKLVPLHPLANMFPLMEGEGFDALVKDIGERGLELPIILHEGKILDGRNRYRACVKTGVAPIFNTYSGDDPVAFVISANVHRRHLSQAERRDLIAKLLKADPKKSNQATAELAKSSDKTVASVRTELEAHSEIPSVDRTDTKGRKSPAKKPRKGSIKTTGALPGPNPEKARDTWRADPVPTASSTRHAPNGEVLAPIPGIGSPVRIPDAAATEQARREHAAFQVSACLENLTRAEISPAELVSYLHTVHGTEWIAEKIDRVRRLLQAMTGEMEAINPNYLEVLRAIQTKLDGAAP